MQPRLNQLRSFVGPVHVVEPVSGCLDFAFATCELLQAHAIKAAALPVKKRIHAHFVRPLCFFPHGKRVRTDLAGPNLKHQILASQALHNNRS